MTAQRNIQYLLSFEPVILIEHVGRTICLERLDSTSHNLGVRAPNLFFPLACGGFRRRLWQFTESSLRFLRVEGPWQAAQHAVDHHWMRLEEDDAAVSRVSPDLDVAQNLRARVTRVLVFGTIYQGAASVHVFEPQPFGCVSFELLTRAYIYIYIYMYIYIYICDAGIPSPAQEYRKQKVQWGASLSTLHL